MGGAAIKSPPPLRRFSWGGETIRYRPRCKCKNGVGKISCRGGSLSASNWCWGAYNLQLIISERSVFMPGRKTIRPGRGFPTAFRIRGPKPSPLATPLPFSSFKTFFFSKITYLNQCLVSLVDQPVIKNPQAFITPHPHQLSNISDSIGGRLEQSLRNTRQISKIEDVVELGWRWWQFTYYGLVQV